MPLLEDRELGDEAPTDLRASLSRLRPKFTTALSDFGEAEKFVLEGDSLLQYALADPRLDWARGGQQLHLLYVVEGFLKALAGP